MKKGMPHDKECLTCDYAQIESVPTMAFVGTVSTVPNLTGTINGARPDWLVAL